MNSAAEEASSAAEKSGGNSKGAAAAVEMTSGMLSRSARYTCAAQTRALTLVCVHVAAARRWNRGAAEGVLISRPTTSKSWKKRTYAPPGQRGRRERSTAKLQCTCYRIGERRGSAELQAPRALEGTCLCVYAGCGQDRHHHRLPAGRKQPAYAHFNTNHNSRRLRNSLAMKGKRNSSRDIYQDCSSDDMVSVGRKFNTSIPLASSLPKNGVPAAHEPFEAVASTNALLLAPSP
eukprot:2454224-Pleurochrysis_carterae.AAC.1